MSGLDFACVAAETERYAAAPTIGLRLRITDAADSPVHNILLCCQVRIQPRQRHYSETEAAGLRELYGPPDQWGRSQQPLQLAEIPVVVPPFTGGTEVGLPLPLTYDLEVAAAKYLHALEEGEVPLTLLFSGTVFRKAPQGFTVEQVPWDREAAYRMPVRLWRETMDHHFPAGGWVRLHRDSLRALQEFKSRNALPTWDETVMRLLDTAGRSRDEF